MSFEYEQENAALYTEEYAKQQKENTDNSGVPMLFLKKGVTQLRVLPPWPGSNGRWMRSIEEHNIQVNGQWLSLTCPRAQDMACPLCDEGERLFAEGKETGNTELIEKAKTYQPRIQYLANVICYSSPDGKTSIKEGVRVLKFGTIVKREFLTLNQDVNGWAGIWRVDDGVDLRITRAGEKLQTTYTVVPMPTRSNLHTNLASQGVNLDDLNLVNLDEIFPPRSYEELQNVMAGVVRTPGFRPAPQKVQLEETPAPVVTPPPMPVVPSTIPGAVPYPVVKPSVTAPVTAPPLSPVIPPNDTTVAPPTTVVPPWVNTNEEDKSNG